MEEINYMFWHYDLFPYLLSSEMNGNIDAEGYAKAKGYGGSKFKVSFVVWGDKGKALAITLEMIRDAYRTFMDDSKEVWKEKIDDTLKIYGVEKLT